MLFYSFIMAPVAFMVNVYADECPNSWSLHDGRCYMVISDTKTWDDGQARCESMESYLVTITSVEEHDFVRNLCSVNGLSKVWIGYNDKIMEDNFEWVTGEPATFEDWEDGQPDNLFDAQDCVWMFCGSSGDWDDRGCDSWFSKAQIVCEKGTTALTTQFSTLDTTASATSKWSTTALTTQFTTRSATSKGSTTALTTQFSTLDTTTSATSKGKLLQFFGTQVLGKAGVKGCSPPNHLEDLSIDLINTRSIFRCCKLCMSQRQCNAIQIEYQSNVLNCYILQHAGDSEQYQQHNLPCAVFNLKQL